MSNELKDWEADKKQTIEVITQALNKGKKVIITYKDTPYEVEAGVHSESCDECLEKFWIPNNDGEYLAPDAFLLLYAEGSEKGCGALALCKNCLATEFQTLDIKE